MGQKCPKRLRLPAGKNTHEHMGRIVPGEDIIEVAMGSHGWQSRSGLERNPAGILAAASLHNPFKTSSSSSSWLLSAVTRRTVLVSWASTPRPAVRTSGAHCSNRTFPVAAAFECASEFAKGPRDHAATWRCPGRRSAAGP